MTLRLVAFNFLEGELKNINFRFCYAQSLLEEEKVSQKRKQPWEKRSQTLRPRKLTAAAAAAVCLLH